MDELDKKIKKEHNKHKKAEQEMELSKRRNAQQQARDGLKDAMVEQFNEYYGEDIEDINSWQVLCGVLGISPIPQKLDACRNVGGFRYSLFNSRY